ncbi:DUF3473 domain-containing protein [Microvirga sp. BT688]|nr:DUF3473 domain-containing protein [Microvirga sp.]
MSIDVEDWFQTENMKGVIERDRWDSCELRVERNTMRILDILDARKTRATFFVLGWVAERCPGLVHQIASMGHEVASHGYGHELVYSLTPKQFRADITRSKKHLEDLIGKSVLGYRAPCFSITEWAIEILQEEGFTYDSSAVPTIAHDRYGKLDGIETRTPIVAIRDGFYEVCVSCIPVGQRGIPWGGGGYFRFLPYAVWKQGVRAILRSGRPYVFYIHPWEFDPLQPRPTGLKATTNFRQRVNLQRCEARFSALVRDVNWIPICELLDTRKSAAAPIPALPLVGRRVEGALP